MHDQDTLNGATGSGDFQRKYIFSVLTLVAALFVVHFFQKRADKEILTNSRAVSRAATLKRDGGIKVIDGSFDHRQTFGIQECA